MIELLCVVVGLAVGFAAGWFIASARVRAEGAVRLGDANNRIGAAEGTVSQLQTQLKTSQEDYTSLRKDLSAEMKSRVQAETRLEEVTKGMEEQKRLLGEAEKQLVDTFKALSSAALEANNKSFAQRAGDLIKPLSESLKEYEQHVREMEKAREGAYSKLEEQLKTLSTTERDLQKETGNLVTALRNPQVRGRWGEVTLRRVVELAGLSDHCDFTEQVSVQAEEGRLRPDMVVHLPTERMIVVDSKVSLDAYLSAVSAETEAKREEFLAAHARQGRDHVKKLSQKSYWDQFREAPEFVVMFIPGECFFSAALECDRTLIEDAADKRVILATPTTLIALLKSVVYGWRQESMARSAQEVSDLGKQLYERLKTFCEHLANMGRNLARVTISYNDAIGSIDSRVFPAARKFEDLKVAGDARIPEIPPIEVTPRPLTAPEAVPGGDTEQKDEPQ